MANRAKFTGRYCKPTTLRAILRGLEECQSKLSLAKELKVSTNTIDVIERNHKQTIEERKQHIAAIAARNAITSAELIEDKLNGADAHKIPVNMLVPIFGVSVDKIIGLSPDPLQIHHTHEHTHKVSLRQAWDDLISERSTIHVEPSPLALPVPVTSEAATCSVSQAEGQDQAVIQLNGTNPQPIPVPRCILSPETEVIPEPKQSL